MKQSHSLISFSKRLFSLRQRLSFLIFASLLITITSSNFTDTAVLDFVGINNVNAQSNTKASKKRQTVRFYKVNNLLQADRLRFTNKAASKPGCHNFIKKTRVHRIVQLGYESCSFYAKKACLADSILSAVTEKDKTPTTQLTQGLSWFFDLEKKRGERMKSWHCE